MVLRRAIIAVAQAFQLAAYSCYSVISNFFQRIDSNKQCHCVQRSRLYGTHHCWRYFFPSHLKFFSDKTVLCCIHFLTLVCSKRDSPLLLSVMLFCSEKPFVTFSGEFPHPIFAILRYSNALLPVRTKLITLFSTVLADFTVFLNRFSESVKILIDVFV